MRMSPEQADHRLELERDGWFQDDTPNADVGDDDWPPRRPEPPLQAPWSISFGPALSRKDPA